MGITRNLEAALRHISYQDRPRILWVDAVCVYSDRSRMKHLGNLRCLFPHREEPNRDQDNFLYVFKVKTYQYIANYLYWSPNSRTLWPTSTFLHQIIFVIRHQRFF